jgi:hypothetical protein
MPTIKTILSLLAVLCAYGVVGRMDYDDAVMMENAYKQPVHTDCSSEVPPLSSYPNQPVRTSVTNEAVTVPVDGCDAQRY